MSPSAKKSRPTSKKVRSRTPAPAAKPVAKGRTARTQITAAVRAGQRGEQVDLAALHEAFESLRDATEQSTRLFALAVEEAQVLDSLGPASCDARSLGEARFTALLRVLEGLDDGADGAGLDFAAERLEKHLRTAAGRGLDMATQSRALAALLNGHVLAGDLETAATVAARWVKRTEKYATEHADGRGELLRALSRSVQVAAAAGDMVAALRWARAHVTALRANATVGEHATLADALATVAALCASAADPAQTQVAASEWLAAERDLASSRDATTRVDRRIAALGLLATAASANGALDVVETAAMERRSLARAEFEATSHPELRGFAADVLAESLRDLIELQLSQNEWPGAIDTAREWLDLESGIRRDDDIRLAAALAMNATLTAQTGAWEACLLATERLLEMAPVRALRASYPPATRKGKGAERNSKSKKTLAPADHDDSDWRSFCDIALAFSARAYYAKSDYEAAARCARERLHDLAAPQSDDLAADSLATTLVTLAQSEEALVRAEEAEAPAWEGFRSQARNMHAAVEALPRGRSDAGLLCATLAWVAHSEALTEAEPSAQRHADEARTKLASLTMASRELVAYVVFVHESTRPVRGRKEAPISRDPHTISARALAAAVHGDAARAASYLATIDLDALASQPDALAHTLASGVRILSRLRFDDPERVASETAWREVAAYATLLAARP